VWLYFMGILNTRNAMRLYFMGILNTQIWNGVIWKYQDFIRKIWNVAIQI
jgi:hypothetical protein